jgi:hypothetical protein
MKYTCKKIPFSEMWRGVGLVRTAVLEELFTFIIKVERIHEPGKTLAVTSRLLVTAMC